MKGSFYPRLAWTGLIKNSRLSLPYLITCISMVAMHYILAFLSSPSVAVLLPRGGDQLAIIMTLGSFVIFLFSLIFLYYTYSFLNRRRAKEYGLYNVLGMGKRNLVRIVLWESLIIALVSLAVGLALGIALSKLAELGLINMMNSAIDYRIRVNIPALVQTVVLYSLLFLLNGLASIVRTSKNSAVSLMRSENVGEKPPKGNWLLAVLGLLILALAYYIAITIDNAFDAMNWFFIAVLMVIVATYLILIAGSVKLCRALQKNKRFYYQPQHFVSVSSMAYRMKRNGAGLASICIIATMVLVMLSSTTCLWAGLDNMIDLSSARELNLQSWTHEISVLTDENLKPLRETISSVTNDHGAEVQNVIDYRYAYLVGSVSGQEVYHGADPGREPAVRGESRELYLFSEADFVAKTGKKADLADNEVLLFTERCEYLEPALTLTVGNSSHTYTVKSSGIGIPDGIGMSANLPVMTVVVPDLFTALEGSSSEYTSVFLYWMYSFDTGTDNESNVNLMRELNTQLTQQYLTDASGWINMQISDRAGDAADMRAVYGGLFYIGIVLSVVFLLAAVLIIYYKQISEGYEDAARFDIMQKVGMTKPDIKKSISAQLLLVFLLPLAFAGLHLAFAFPMILKMLRMFGMTNTGLFVRTTLISFTAFTLFYIIIYRLTSSSYYHIVSGTEGKTV